MDEFTFHTRQIQLFLFEVIITNKEGTKFGRMYQSFAPVSDREIFEVFLKEPKEFFIEVENISEGNKPCMALVKL